MRNIIFLKLGGSLITDKDRPHTVRSDVLDRITAEIATALRANPELRLLIGHGSGSFGHIPAKKFKTREGVGSPQEWLGFTEVWREAITLNQLVMNALHKAKIPAIAFSPCAQVLAVDGRISDWDTVQIRSALIHGLVPVVYGDVVFDSLRGGTIISTEEQFEFLSSQFEPERILLAGIEPGVWSDFPQRTTFLPKITPASLLNIHESLADSASPDVTGGMRSKVQTMMKLIENGSCREILIFSGREPGLITQAVSGEVVGTRLCLE
jgi:isopentenyl phosphate kinase